MFLFVSLSVLRPSLFFSNATATTEIYTLSLHDALPIWRHRRRRTAPGDGVRIGATVARVAVANRARVLATKFHRREFGRSEEHTSELQSRRDLVCRLLLEKKKKKNKKNETSTKEYKSI